MNAYQIICESLKIGHIPENWNIYKVGPKTAEKYQHKQKYDWIMYAGGNDWEPNFKYITVYVQKKITLSSGSSSKIWIKVKYPQELLSSNGEEDPKKSDKQTEFGKKVADLWIRTAKEIRHSQLEDYQKWKNSSNKIALPQYRGEWFDAFALALKDPKVTPLIDEKGIDSTDWVSSKSDQENYGYIEKSVTKRTIEN